MMAYSSMFDPNLYNISNEQNCMFICAYYTKILYKKSPKTIRPPRVRVTFRVDHQLVPDDVPDPSHRSGDIAYVSQRSFNQPLGVLASAGDAGPAFEAMLSRVEIPFDLRTREPYGPLIWGLGFPGEYRLVGDVAAELSRASERVLREAAMVGANRRALKEIQMSVCIRKRTFVSPKVYRWTPHPDESDDDDEAAPEELLETEACGGDESDYDSECPICFNDYSTGTRVIQVPCSHLFHEDCIVSWCKTSPTCPLCRFELDPETLEH